MFAPDVTIANLTTELKLIANILTEGLEMVFNVSIFRNLKRCKGMSTCGDAFIGDRDMEEDNERWRERLSQYIDFVTSHNYNPIYLAQASPDTKMWHLMEKHGSY